MVFAFVVLVPIGLLVFFALSIWSADRRTAAVPLDPANYQAAAPDLVRLCQTDPQLLKQKYGEVDASQVPSIGRLNPEVGVLSVRPDEADVTWGGGFCHAGWRLVRSPDEDEHAPSHTWTLYFWDEGDRRGRVLQTFDMPSDARFTEQDPGFGAPQRLVRPPPPAGEKQPPASTEPF
jgi:hypothetical protein